MFLSPRVSNAISPRTSFHRALRLLALGGLLAGTWGCGTHHWAQVETSALPLPPGEQVIHSSRLLVLVDKKQHDTQCVVYKDYHPVCFFNLREALHSGLSQTLWPAFSEVVLGKEKDIRPGDYVLQIEVMLDALPPDQSGPGWSAGARSRFRLLLDNKVLAEKNMASRSRAHFAYGAPLGEGATEVTNATIFAISQTIAPIPETRAQEAVLLPRVAARTIVAAPRVARAVVSVDDSSEKNQAAGNVVARGAQKAKSSVESVHLKTRE